MDLLDMWKDEMGCASLSLFVMGVPKDLATYQKLLAYYEHLIYLFAFDTGFEPLVAIYDGEIRSTPWLYEFFSNSPIYMQVSADYYNAKLEDINQQFTDQFLGNLALFWSVIIPDILAHTLASQPKQLFESKANKSLTMRGVTLATSGDFIKWMSHNYSLGLKNYAPFIASPELWRVWNPIIDLYWWTLVGHIICLRCFKNIDESQRIKPFIETQKVAITLNGNDYSEARLTGQGEITVCIPKAHLNTGVNRICFNTYNVIACVQNIDLYTKFHLGLGFMQNVTVSPPATNCTLADFTQTYTLDGTYSAGNSVLYAGFYFWNPGKLRLKLDFDFNYTPHYAFRPIIGAYYKRPPNFEVMVAYTNECPPGRHSIILPGLEFFKIKAGFAARYVGGDGPAFTMGNFTFEVLPDDYVIPNEESYFQYPNIDYCPSTPWE